MNRPERHECVDIGKPGLNGTVDKIRLVCLGRRDRRVAVENAVGLTLDSLPDMAIVARLRRRYGWHDVGTVNEAERGVAERIVAEERRTSGSRAAEGINHRRLSLELGRRAHCRKYRQCAAQTVTAKEQSLPGRGGIGDHGLDIRPD